MYIVVCVYRLHIVVVVVFWDGVLLTLTKVLMGGYDKHYEVSRFLDNTLYSDCLLYTSPSPRDSGISRMPSSA